MAICSVVDGSGEAVGRRLNILERDAGLFGVDRPGAAWDWMAQTGQAPEGADWVRPQVAQSWYRCIEDYRLSPRIGLLRPEVQSDLEHSSPPDLASGAAVSNTLVTMAVNLQPILRDTGVTLLLADAGGALLHVTDGGAALGPMGRRLARIGESWSERVIGNNGLGTAAAVLEPVAFDGKEHFSPELHPFATVGHPLFSHDGQLVGLLGLITDKSSSAQTLLGLVRMAAHLIEANLFEIQAPGAFTLRLRSDQAEAAAPKRPYLADGLISLDEQGLIVGATRSGLNLLSYEHYSDILLQPIETILGVGVAELRRRAAFGGASALKTPAGWSLNAELNIAPRASSPKMRSIGCPSANRPSVDPPPSFGARRGRPEAAAGAWRDVVHDSALERAISLQS